MPHITTSQILDQLQGDPDYGAFVRETNPQTAWDLVDRARRNLAAVNVKLHKIGNLDFRKKKKRSQNQEALDRSVDLIKEIMRVEAPKVRKNKENIRGLAYMAGRGELSQALLDRRNREVPWEFCIRTQNEALIEGFEWVVRSSGTLQIRADASEEEREERTKAIKDSLHGAMVAVVRNNMDVTDVATMDFLNRNAGSKHANYRIPTMGVRNEFYGGVTIGKYLQLWVAGYARALRSDAARDRNKWYDIACLQLIGNIIAHGYGDGNGRSARALFACTQIQKNLQFVAPSYRWTLDRTANPLDNIPVYQTEEDAINGQLGVLDLV
jgi:hypothetical protein